MKDRKLTDDPTYYKRKKREWYLKNKEKVSAQSKAWREANPERAKANITRWKNENPDRVRIHSKRKGQKQTLKKYNLTNEQYEEMFRAQNGLCAICGRAWEKRRLAVDHNHKTGKVRGLLCGSCNIRLGYIEMVKRMRLNLRPFLRYLEKYDGPQPDELIP